MRFVVFDTETNGLPSAWNARHDDISSWPRIVQIAWVVVEGQSRFPQSFIVKPDGFAIPSSASRIHGITHERASKDGKPLRYVMSCFAEDMSDAELLVAHNIDFDLPVANCEFIRSNVSSTIADKSLYCTMRSSTDLCKLPGNRPNEYKWPKLEELHYYLFGRGFQGAHDALQDANAATDCYLELIKRGVA